MIRPLTEGPQAIVRALSAAIMGKATSVVLATYLGKKGGHLSQETPA